jgi:hypothetical protein
MNHPKTSSLVTSLFPFVVLLAVVNVALESSATSAALRAAVSTVGSFSLLTYAGYHTRTRGGGRGQATGVAFRLSILGGLLSLAGNVLIATAGGNPQAFAGLGNLAQLAPSFWALELVLWAIVLSLALGVTWMSAWLLSGLGYWIAGEQN